jgi:spore coat polysaccharide biosynthesis protein SpsF (cytidylyltransferase family)
MNEYDYVSNVDPRFRTSPDGWDCEVISSRMLDWLGQNAQTPEEKEHVTLKARTDPPPWIRHGVTIGFYDLADIKISVDTTDDLEKVRNEWAKVRTKVDTALEYFGEYNVHRF